MLNSPFSKFRTRHTARRRDQQGVVLITALIVLIAMMLAAVGLMRAGLTTNRVSGNLAFRQSATQSTDVGVETAVAWLENNNSGVSLQQNIDIDGAHPIGYFASRQDPAAGQSWEQYWNDVLKPTRRVNELATDAVTGNKVSYVIQRLCNAVGDPNAGIGCATSPDSTGSEGNSQGSGVTALLTSSKLYYRITVRVEGPRNTVSLVQAVVAM